MDMTPMDLFRSTLLEPLQQLLDGLPGTTVVTVPSVRDLVSDHAVFPQSEFGANAFDDPASPISNPSVAQLYLSLACAADIFAPQPMSFLPQWRLVLCIKRRRALPPSERRVLQDHV